MHKRLTGLLACKPRLLRRGQGEAIWNRHFPYPKVPTFRAESFSFWLVLAAVLMFTMMQTGCATWGPEAAKTPLPKGERDITRKGWWYARFQMIWSENEDPNLYLDALLAHKIVSPVLDQYQKNIVLWRFHRRAARDAAGHQFSFIFYSTPSTARNICNSIKADPLLDRLQQAGVIIRNTCDDTDRTLRPGLEDTSDKTWPVPIQRSWPYFIMGVSQTWLYLISEIAEKNADGHAPSSLQEIQAFYQQINESINILWQEEGRHAFLHHLNAIFGYEPVIVHEKRLMQF